MFFASDNSGPVHPSVMAAMAQANQGYAMAYGDDPQMDEVRTRLRDILEAPEAAVHLVTTGTAANSLALSTLCNPWQTVFCSTVAHIHEDECNAPEFFTGGAKLTLVPGGDKMTALALRSAIEGEENRGVHGPQHGPVSITQTTERGTVYTLEELQALSDVAKSFDLPVHMDGARFANAVVALGCSPAEMSWKTGIDVLSFGGTKNGLMGAEAVVFFDPSHAWEFELRRKRAAHLVSKHRFLSAQMTGYLKDNLWLDLAGAANANCARLSAGLRAARVKFLHQPSANIIFATLPRGVHQRLHAAGAVYSLVNGMLEGDADEMVHMRLVCDWSLSHALIDDFLGLLDKAQDP